MLRGRVFLELPARHVMVGEKEAVRANKRPGSSIVQATEARRTWFNQSAVSV